MAKNQTNGMNSSQVPADDRADSAGGEPVCVIVPTLATAARAAYLQRALASIEAQRGVRARPIVVANGPAQDPSLLAAIAARPRLRLLRFHSPDLPAALAAGREAVDSRFFAQLDDDDELMPGALAARLAHLEPRAGLDAVVTNGLIREGAHEEYSIPDVDDVRRRPLEALMERNWLLPGSALFRSAAVSAELFRATPRYLEWTYIALVLASRHAIDFLPAPSVVHYAGHAFSDERSAAACLGRPRAFAAMLALPLPGAVRRALRRKRSAAWHAAAEAHRLAGNRRAALAAHLRSLGSVAGLRYLGFARHLLRARSAGQAGTIPRPDTVRESPR